MGVGGSVDYQDEMSVHLKQELDNTWPERRQS